MATTSNVPDRGVDIGALAGEIQSETAERIASFVVLSANYCEAEGNPLNERQKIEVFRQALRHFDGFEASIAAKLRFDLEEHGVKTWGLAQELEELITGQGGR